MKDQYGSTIPGDLVVICYEPWLADDEIKAVMDADWYEDYFSGLIFVSRSQLPPLISESAYADPEDCLDDPIEEMDLNLIPDCLKRLDYKDGFYHA
jgi:hypothetical protein